MKTDAERLQFVIRFAQMDLDTLRAGDWLNLREDCMAFLGIEVHGGLTAIQTPEESGRIVALPLHAPLPTEFAVEDCIALQADTRRILDEWVGPAPGEQGMLSPHDIHVLYTVTRTRSQTGASWVSWLQVQGTTRELFLIILLHLLGRESMDAIRHCPECGTIFYRVGKQQYCSRPCSNRANVRTWRPKQAVKQVEADRARKRYATKKKPARVTPRPRKGSTAKAETPRES
jgi:hypothetical protein